MFFERTLTSKPLSDCQSNPTPNGDWLEFYLLRLSHKILSIYVINTCMTTLGLLLRPLFCIQCMPKATSQFPLFFKLLHLTTPCSFICCSTFLSINTTIRTHIICSKGFRYNIFSFWGLKNLLSR